MRKQSGKDDTAPKKPLLFMGVMCHGQSLALSTSSNQSGITEFRKAGPLLDDCAPFSAIGKMELNLIENPSIHQPKLKSKPEIIAKCDEWQYGSGEHSSAQKAIIGSVEILVGTDY